MHHRHVGVLQAGPADLEVGDPIAVLGEQLAYERRGVRGRVDEPVAVEAPAHLGLARDLAGELVGAAVGDDLAAGQDEDPVGQLLRLVEVVGGEQDRGVLEVGQHVYEVVEPAPCLRVEAGGRFVEEQQFGPADQADRNVEPAALAARQRADPLLGVLRQPDRTDELVDGVGALPVGRGVRLVEAAQVMQQVADPPAPVVAPGLQDDAEPRTPLLATPGRVGSEHADLTGRAHPEPLQDLDDRGLAGAVGAEQGDHLAGASGEVHTGEHILGAVAHA
jgi:hypothetical protein